MEVYTKKSYKVFRFIVGLILSGACLLWSSLAVLNYFEQPISTRITYTLGDDGKSISLPHLSFCRISHYQYQSLDNCRKNSFNFLEVITRCWNDYDIKTIVKSFDYEKEEIVEDVQFYPGYGREINEKIDFSWEKIYHRSVGLCHTLKIKTQLPVHDGNFIVLVMKRVPSYVGIMIHSGNDFPDAHLINSVIYFENKSMDITFRKKIIQRETTRKFPCGKFNQKTYEEIQDDEMIKKDFGCKIDFLNPIEKDLPECDEETTKKVIGIIWNKSDLNQTWQSCDKIKFTASTQTYSTSSFNQTLQLWIGYDEMEVEHQKTYINYDIQSVIGEVGGILGQFL